MEEICSNCSYVHPSCTGSDCATSFFSAYAGYFFHLASLFTSSVSHIILPSYHFGCCCGCCLLLKVKMHFHHHWRLYDGENSKQATFGQFSIAEAVRKRHKQYIVYVLDWYIYIYIWMHFLTAQVLDTYGKFAVVFGRP